MIAPHTMLLTDVAMETLGVTFLVMLICGRFVAASADADDEDDNCSSRGCNAAIAVLGRAQNALCA
jgi:hypothetical protein